MHEMAIALNILNIVTAVAQREGAQRITKVNVVVGELRGIIPLQLIYSFGLIAEGTMARGAQLDLEIIPVTVRCKRCGETFIVKDHRYTCLKCQGEDVQTIGGTELRVKDIEVE